jgi:hypothetical protein
MPESKGKFGDVGGFLTSTIQIIVRLVLIACVGASVLTVVKMDIKELEDIFPTDPSKPPYPQSEDPPGGATPVAELFPKTNPGDPKPDTEAFLKGILEYFYPMKRKSFPYKNWFTEEKFSGSYSYVIAKWMTVTCANAFINWRSWYMSVVLLGRTCLETLPKITDLFLFYVWPYALMYLIMLPIIPIIGSAMAFLGSISYNVPAAPLLALAPIAGICVAVANIVAGGIFNVYAWIVSFFIYLGGFALGFVNIGWWIGIGIAIWVWSIMQLFFAPLLMTKGIERTKEEIGKHKRSLTLIFIFLIVQAATKYLTPAGSIGIIISVAA